MFRRAKVFNMKNSKLKIKRIICILFVITFLMGCGQTPPGESSATGTNPQTQNSSSDDAVSATTDEANAKKEYDESEFKTVDWFVTGATSLPTPWNLDMPVMAEISKKTGVIMQANIPAQDADTKLNLLMVNGDLPDVITIMNETLYAELIASDQVWNIKEFFETYLPDAKIINGGFPEDIRNAIEIRDGGWYSIPSHINSVDNEKIWPIPDSTKEYWEGMKTANQFTMVLNRTIMKEYGISEESVKTEQGLLDAMKKIKDAGATNENGGSVYPLMIHANAVLTTNNALYSIFGAMPVDEDGNYRSEYYSDSYRDALEFLNTCYRDGFFDPAILTMDQASMVALMNEDRVFCHIGGTAADAMCDRKVKDENGKETNEYVYYCPGPIAWESGFVPVIGVNNTVAKGWLQTFISKSCEEPEAVARFIDYLYMEEEGLALWNYGIEGTHWIENEKGLIERTEAGKEAYDNMATTGMGAFWLFCNTSYDRSIQNITSNIEDNVAAVYGRSPETHLYDSTALVLPSGYIEAGSSYDITKIEVDNYVPQQFAKIVMAENDEQFDTLYQEFLKQLDKLGLPELDEYKNKVVQENYETYGYKLKAVN